MFSLPRLSLVVCVLLAANSAFAQFHDADPEAAAAFEAMVDSYRERPALTVRTTVTVEVTEDDLAARSSEVQAEFTLGRDRMLLARLRGLECYVSDGSVTAVHTENENAYFHMGDEGSPYYALMAVFMDLPFPHLALALGEEDMEDLYMQFHPKAPWLRPTGVRLTHDDGKDVQVITMTSDFEHLEMRIDPQTKLIESMTLEITGGHLVHPGTTMLYEHAFEYETHDEPLPKETFTFEAGERELVDMIAQLDPRGGAAAARRGMPAGAVVGEPAPPLVLATLDGGAVDLDELRGQVVVLDFWATWCGPCLPALRTLHEVDRWVRDELLPARIITVNTFEIPNVADNTPDDRLEQVSDFWREHSFRLPVAMDFTDETAALYGVGGIPTTFVIRSDGIVHSRHVGAGSDYLNAIKRDIREAIAELEAE